jgi:phosphomannomutase
LRKAIIDCSNGVGGIHQEVMNKMILNKYFQIHCINIDDLAFLNDGCGSEFVQKDKKIPKNLLECISKNFPEENNENISLVAFDGDADRIVY